MLSRQLVCRVETSRPLRLVERSRNISLHPSVHRAGAKGECPERSEGGGFFLFTQQGIPSPLRGPLPFNKGRFLRSRLVERSRNISTVFRRSFRFGQDDGGAVGT